MRRCRSTASRHGSPPRSATVPLLARSRPSSTRIVVDLPAPLGPRKPVMSPGATVRSRPSRALVRPNVLTNPCISTAGWVAPLVLARCRDVAVIVISSSRVAERNALFAPGEKRLVHRRVGHQAVGVQLQGGQHHVLGVVAKDGTQVGGVVVHL